MGYLKKKILFMHRFTMYGIFEDENLIHVPIHHVWDIWRRKYYSYTNSLCMGYLKKKIHHMHQITMYRIFEDIPVLCVKTELNVIIWNGNWNGYKKIERKNLGNNDKIQIN